MKSYQANKQVYFVIPEFGAVPFTATWLENPSRKICHINDDHADTVSTVGDTAAQNVCSTTRFITSLTPRRARLSCLVPSYSSLVDVHSINQVRDSMRSDLPTPHHPREECSSRALRSMASIWVAQLTCMMSKG